ncbi:MAG: hypothetical protein ACE5HQ_12935 [Gemmatimonadota bacterium]
MVRQLVYAMLWIPTAASLACTMGPDRRRVLGTLEISEFDPVKVALPEVVSRNVGFDVVVRTYGGGCTERGDTKVTVKGLSATVVPFDFELVGPTLNCPDILRSLTHAVELRFAQAGLARVVVRGWSELQQDTIDVERTVLVR